MRDTFEKVYAVVRRIPSGCVCTYGGVARMLGNARLARVVGYALNVCPADVPAHRVVNRNGGLCDAFEPMGRETHRVLLQWEGVPFRADGTVDVERCVWRGDHSAEERPHAHR